MLELAGQLGRTVEANPYGFADVYALIPCWREPALRLETTAVAEPVGGWRAFLERLDGTAKGSSARGSRTSCGGVSSARRRWPA